MLRFEKVGKMVYMINVESGIVLAKGQDEVQKLLKYLSENQKRIDFQVVE